MLYRNAKTGAVIDSPCVIRGEHWEPIEESQKPAARKPKKAEPKKAEPKKEG